VQEDEGRVPANGGRVTVEARPGVLSNVAEQNNGRPRLLVHLLNYASSPAGGARVKVQGKFSTARLLTPDSARTAVRLVPASGSGVEVEVPELATYSLLVLE
jgi:membrane protein implicated in regulation of membrane protease activity